MKIIGRDIKSRSLHELPIPIPLDAASHPGTKVLGEDGQVYRSERWPTADDPYTWMSTAQIAEDILADVIRLSGQQQEITVGPGGDVAELADAFDLLRPFAPAASKDAQNATSFVTMLDGYTRVTKPLLLDEKDYSWVELRHETPGTEVLVDVSALSPSVGLFGADRLFFLTTSGLRISANFKLDYEWSPGQTLIDGNSVHGVTSYSGRTVLQNARIANFTDNLWFGYGANLQFDISVSEDARRYAAQFFNGAFLTARQSVFRGAVNSIRVRDGGVVNLRGSALDPFYNDFRRTEGVDSSVDMFMDRGAAYIRAGSLGGINREPGISKFAVLVDGRAQELALYYATTGDLPSADLWPNRITSTEDGPVYSDGTEWKPIIIQQQIHVGPTPPDDPNQLWLDTSA
jgi:hypothetical protein